MAGVFKILSLLAIVVVLALLGLVGFMGISGKLNSESIGMIVKALQGKKLIEETEIVAQPDQPTSQPADTAELKEPTLGMSLSEVSLATLDRQRRTVNDSRRRVKDAELLLLQNVESFNEEKRIFYKQVQAQQKANENEGFVKMLQAYSNMDEEQAKEDFMELDIEVVVTYLMNMKPRRVNKILGEFTTDDEQKRRRQIGERIRTQKIEVQNKSNESY